MRRNGGAWAAIIGYRWGSVELFAVRCGGVATRVEPVAPLLSHAPHQQAEAEEGAEVADPRPYRGGR